MASRVDDSSNASETASSQQSVYNRTQASEDMQSNSSVLPTTSQQPRESANTSVESSTSAKERHFGISDELYRPVCNHRNSHGQDNQQSTPSDTFGDRSSRLRRSNASLSGRQPNVRGSPSPRTSLEGHQRSSEGQVANGESPSEIWERRQQSQRNYPSGEFMFLCLIFNLYFGGSSV